MTCAAAAAWTPCAVRPPDIADGSEPASPVTISEKKTPMDSTNAVFWKVAIIPPAAPRWPAGTEFMISARLGGANSPDPSPFSASTAANAG